MQNITTLFDFCGVCLGDNTACFFSSIVPVSSIAGISAGAAAGIALAAILGVLLAAWFSKKGEPEESESSSFFVSFSFVFF